MSDNEKLAKRLIDLVASERMDRLVLAIRDAYESTWAAEALIKTVQDLLEECGLL